MAEGWQSGRNRATSIRNDSLSLLIIKGIQIEGRSKMDASHVSAYAIYYTAHSLNADIRLLKTGSDLKKKTGEGSTVRGA